MNDTELKMYQWDLNVFWRNNIEERYIYQVATSIEEAYQTLKDKFSAERIDALELGRIEPIVIPIRNWSEIIYNDNI